MGLRIEEILVGSMYQTFTDSGAAEGQLRADLDRWVITLVSMSVLR